jgi:hypothetical protein
MIRAAAPSGKQSNFVHQDPGVRPASRAAWRTPPYVVVSSPQSVTTWELR